MGFTVKKCPSIEFITGYDIGVDESFCKFCNEKMILALSKSHLKSVANSSKSINIDELIITANILFGKDFAKDCLISAAKSGLYEEPDLLNIYKKIEENNI